MCYRWSRIGGQKAINPRLYISATPSRKTPPLPIVSVTSVIQPKTYAITSTDIWNRWIPRQYHQVSLLSIHRSSRPPNAIPGPWRLAPHLLHGQENDWTVSDDSSWPLWWGEGTRDRARRPCNFLWLRTRTARSKMGPRWPGWGLIFSTFAEGSRRLWVGQATGNRSRTTPSSSSPGNSSLLSHRRSLPAMYQRRNHCGNPSRTFRKRWSDSQVRYAVFWAASWTPVADASTSFWHNYTPLRWKRSVTRSCRTNLAQLGSPSPDVGGGSGSWTCWEPSIPLHPSTSGW